MTGDEYVWTGRGQPDEASRRIVAAIAPLQRDWSAADFSHAAPVVGNSARRARWLLPLAAAAAVIIVALVWLVPRGGSGGGGVASGGWTVADLGDQGRAVGFDEQILAQTDTRLRAGEEPIATLAAGSRAVLRPGKAVRGVWIELHEGTLTTELPAGARGVDVRTPIADVFVKGSVTVALASVQTHAGDATILSADLEIRVPAGSVCAPCAVGPMIPHRSGASVDLVAAIRSFEADQSIESLSRILEVADAGDAQSLWNLLPLVDGGPREKVAWRLSQLVEPPADGVGRGVDGLTALDRATMDAWWQRIRSSR